eukprot:7466461-Prorocentrum_lima.AAC.1
MAFHHCATWWKWKFVFIAIRAFYLSSLIWSPIQPLFMSLPCLCNENSSTELVHQVPMLRS